MEENLEFVLIGLFMLLLWSATTLSTMRDQQNKLDKKLNALISHQGMHYDPLENIPEEIVNEVKAGNKIKAIKLYRTFAGLGLKEASDDINQLTRRLSTKS